MKIRSCIMMLGIGLAAFVVNDGYAVDSQTTFINATNSPVTCVLSWSSVGDSGEFYTTTKTITLKANATLVTDVSSSRWAQYACNDRISSSGYFAPGGTVTIGTSFNSFYFVTAFDFSSYIARISNLSS